MFFWVWALLNKLRNSWSEREGKRTGKGVFTRLASVAGDYEVYEQARVVTGFFITVLG